MKSEQRNRKKGKGISLDVRAMPENYSRPGILLYEEWEKKRDLRVVQEQDPCGDGLERREPSAGNVGEAEADVDWECLIDGEGQS